MSNIVPFTTDLGVEKSEIENAPILTNVSLPSGYALFRDGVYQIINDDMDETPILICSPFRINATFSDQTGKGWGALIAVRNRDAMWNEMPVTHERLVRYPAEVIGNLVNAGLELAPDRKSKERLLALIKIWKPLTRLTTVTRMGWVDDTHSAFVAGDHVIGTTKVLPLINVPAGLTSTGSIDSWKQHLGAKCCGNQNMILAVCLALSGPLLLVLGVNGGGLHFRGASSSGKTTLLNLAASVWGSPQLVRQWRATSNGLEGIAAALNDMLLPLDEIAEISARALPETIYMLANGVGKVRMNRDAQLSDTSQWRLALISSGEISIEEKLQEGGRGHMAGQEVRLLDIEADNRAHGVFDELHGTSNGASFADHIKQASKSNHGALGRAFASKLIEQIESGDFSKQLEVLKCFQADAIACISGDVDGQVSRVVHRFGVLALAGHIATGWGLTGWGEREALEHAEAAFLEWHDRRFGSKQQDLAKFIPPLQQFLAANMAAFPVAGAPASSEPILGWQDPSRIYLTPESWHRVYPGILGSKAAQALIAANLMVQGDGGRQMCKGPRGIPGRPRLFTLNRKKVTAYKVY